jgi:hypothetical protein
MLLSPPVARLAMSMQVALNRARNVEKGDAIPEQGDCIQRLLEELGEMIDYRSDVWAEAGDVANYVMLLALRIERDRDYHMTGGNDAKGKADT